MPAKSAPQAAGFGKPTAILNGNSWPEVSADPQLALRLDGLRIVLVVPHDRALISVKC